MTNDPLSRRFLMSDAMILVAATAVGFAQSRDQANDWVDGSLAMSISLLAYWSLACLLLRLRRPRPPLSRLINQPGTSACLAGGGPSGFLQLLALWDKPRFMGYLVGSAFLGGFAVAAVWVVQKLGDDMEPEAGWVDRLGVALGFGWIAFFVVFCFPYFLNG